jgi:glycosyltransferase involved in cell wall biosynthesis
MQPIIHLVVSDLYSGDAIGNFVFAIYHLLQQHSFSVQLYAERADSSAPGVQSYATFFKQVHPEDCLLYQISNYDPILPQLMATPCRRVLYYHNITPGKFFEPWSIETQKLLDAGRAALPLIASAHAALANSHYSLAEIEAFLPTETPRQVFPPFLARQLNYAKISAPTPINPPFLLLLGRIVPHKRVEKALDIFSLLRRKIPDLNLIVAGSQYEPYTAILKASISENAALSGSVCFTGPLPAENIQALLRQASGLLHTSAHEGFCMPILEAMMVGTLVFAHVQPAVLETLNGTGVTFDAGQSDEAAECILQILCDTNPATRERIIVAQKYQAQKLLAKAAESTLLDILTYHLH